MFPRGIALCSIFALTTVAQGGVRVQLVPTLKVCNGGPNFNLACVSNTNCPDAASCPSGDCTCGIPNPPKYPPTLPGKVSVVQVDVNLVQDAGESDQRLRMMEFDMTDTSAFLSFKVCDGGPRSNQGCASDSDCPDAPAPACPGGDCTCGPTFPLTHDRGTSGTGDDVRFWWFGSLADCASSASFCGFGHYMDDDRPAGLADTRVDVLSNAFYNLTASAQAQILLPGNGTPVTVGKLHVTMPSGAGSFLFSLTNPDDTGTDRGARLDFGFDPHVIWRARNPSPNNISGGEMTFEVCNTNPCPPTCTSPGVTKWESVLTHSPNQPVPIALEIPNTGLFSEPRSGIKKIVVTFDSAINAATAIPANVTVCGNNVANSPVDLSGVTMTAGTVAGSGDTKMEINFTPGLPDYARYRIELKSGVQAVGGCSVVAGTGGLSRILTALQGDSGGAAGGGDRRVNSTDLTLVRGFAAAGINPIDPATLNHVRSDVNNDGRINSTDLTLVRNRAALANNAQSINDPVCP